MFFRHIVLVCLLFTSASALFSQGFRSINGVGNNLNQSNWGATDTELLYPSGIAFEDEIGASNGLDRPNPRYISNEVFRQDSVLPDYMHLSDYCWVFGQFIDHDITLNPENEHEAMSIPVPQGDPWFDPFNTGQVEIPMLRTAYMQDSGTDKDNPRKFFNAITAFVDGSAVYGSTSEHARWLRTRVNGKLKTSQGNLLPFNTYSGQFDSDIDPAAPIMANPVGRTNKYFVSGDVRVNENPLLTSFHTLFVREHNRICDELKSQSPAMRDEQLYQEARRRVGAILQAITYEEWLPTMGVHLSPYTGYDANVNPGIANVFSVAAYRLGHTLLNGNIMRLDNDGNEITGGHLLLRDAYFNPLEIVNAGGIEPYLKGVGVQEQQRFDAKMLDDVRNFLFGPPGAGGLDLAAINIARGRERGLPDYNTIRTKFGMPAITSFSEITTNEDLSNLLENLYQDVNDIDPWVGMLAEDPMNNALFGPTVMTIITWQFEAIRDGDRFYFENDSALSPALKEEIRNTRLYDVLMRNTDLSIMQPHVFQAMPHEEICVSNEDFVSLEGNVQREDGETLNDVNLNLTFSNGNALSAETNALGVYTFADVETCSKFVLNANKQDQANRGVSTLDLALIAKHILNVERLDSPFKILAADVNGSGSVSTLDLVGIRKVILRLEDDFPSGEVWKFVDASYTFPNPEDPWEAPIPFQAELSQLSTAANVGFTAYKMGDVNLSANVDNIASFESRKDVPTIRLTSDRNTLSANELTAINFDLNEITALNAIQFTIEWNSDKVEVFAMESSRMKDFSTSNYAIFVDQAAMTVSWNGSLNSEESSLFTLWVKAKENVELDNVLNLNSTLTSAKAWNDEWMESGISLAYPESLASNIETVQVLKISPNPASDFARVSFELPESSDVIVQVFDMKGALLVIKQGFFESGKQSIDLNEKSFNGSGMYTIRMTSTFGVSTGTLVYYNE